MIDKLDKSLCTGCTACKVVCPKQCIRMKKNEEGFNQPIIDLESCINCNLCEAVCPVMNPLNVHKETSAYAIINKNEEERLNSTSGGFFSVLANYVLDNSGYVVGANYNVQYVVQHIIINNKEELYKLRGAKYSQSELRNIFNQVKELLDKNELVLFSGTPCQVGGLKAYLRKEYSNLITVDLICHGVPSPKVWKSYVEYRSNKDNNGQLPLNINLRSKSSGWSKYGYSVEFDYGSHKYSNVNNQDLFMKVFIGDYCLRESCSNCVFKGIHRVSDFTLGDYWGVWDQLPEMDDNKGTSLVFIHSEKGKQLFDTLNDKVSHASIDVNKSIEMNPSMIRSSKAKDTRNDFLIEVNSENFDEIVNKYYVVNLSKGRLRNRIRNKLKKIYTDNILQKL